MLHFDNAASKANGAAADAVLGQPDFTSAIDSVTQSSMSAPGGVTVDNAGRLWVGDYRAHRVLRFDAAASKANGAPADAVLGQSNFTTTSFGTNASNFALPYNVFIDSAGRLWVADTGNNRVLRFDTAASKANGATADGVLGQPDFTTASQVTTASGMRLPSGVTIDTSGRLFVADTSNHRVLWFDTAVDKANGANADGVLGQPDFTTGTRNTGGISATSLLFLSDATFDAASDTLWVADIDNHRVLRYGIPNAAPTISAIATTTTAEDTATGALAFTVGDAETAVGSLVVSATAANQALVPDASISIGGSGANRTVTITPATNATGTVTITLTASDGGRRTTETFNLTITPVADTPSISNATTAEDMQTTSGLVVSRNVADGSEVTHFKITGITNGALFLNDGTTPVANGSFLTFAQANAGLRFAPAANFVESATFGVQAATSSSDAGLGGGVVTATITITPANDAPDFVVGANQTVRSRAGPQTIANWATGFTPGPASESSQTNLATRWQASRMQRCSPHCRRSRLMAR